MGLLDAVQKFAQNAVDVVTGNKSVGQAVDDIIGKDALNIVAPGLTETIGLIGGAVGGLIGEKPEKPPQSGTKPPPKSGTTPPPKNRTVPPLPNEDVVGIKPSPGSQLLKDPAIQEMLQLLREFKDGFNTQAGYLVLERMLDFFAESGNTPEDYAFDSWDFFNGSVGSGGLVRDCMVRSDVNYPFVMPPDFSVEYPGGPQNLNAWYGAQALCRALEQAQRSPNSAQLMRTMFPSSQTQSGQAI